MDGGTAKTLDARHRIEAREYVRFETTFLVADPSGPPQKRLYVARLAPAEADALAAALARVSRAARKRSGAGSLTIAAHDCAFVVTCLAGEVRLTATFAERRTGRFAVRHEPDVADNLAAGLRLTAEQVRRGI